MNFILNLISIISTFIVIEGVFYIALNSTIGRLENVKKSPLKDVLFLIPGILFIIFFFDFHLPH